MYNRKKFIEKAIKKHNNIYDYSLVNYKSSKEKVKIICKKHGIFEQTPAKHLIGRGCQICGGSNKKTTEQFIIDAKKIHGDLYDYSLVEYKNANSLVIIICKEHGKFNQNPYNHIKGSGCPDCYLESKFKTTEQFIIDAKKIHKKLYDYSNVKYIKNNIPVEIICKEHGSFFQQPSVHLNNGNCPKCADEKKKILLSEFISRSVKIHNDFYNYSNSVYVNNYTKVDIICPIHGTFKQIPKFSYVRTRMPKL